MGRAPCDPHELVVERMPSHVEAFGSLFIMEEVPKRGDGSVVEIGRGGPDAREVRRDVPTGVEGLDFPPKADLLDYFEGFWVGGGPSHRVREHAALSHQAVRVFEEPDFLKARRIAPVA